LYEIWHEEKDHRSITRRETKIKIEESRRESGGRRQSARHEKRSQIRACQTKSAGAKRGSARSSSRLEIRGRDGVGSSENQSRLIRESDIRRKAQHPGPCARAAPPGPTSPTPARRDSANFAGARPFA